MGMATSETVNALSPDMSNFASVDVRAGAVWPLPSGIGRSHARLILFREYLGDVANF
jgi:hypothetical protein